MSTKLLLASGNAGKLAELRRLVTAAGLDVAVLGLADVAPYPEPVENGLTFEDNALLKARAGVAATDLPCLADDSGLQVDALNQMPGVRSARWAGPERDDEANNALLLAQLDDVAEPRRSARFVCAAALALPDGRFLVERGEMAGRIAYEERGSNGFGYDPLFLPTGSDRTTAELSAEAKDRISHRGQAMRAMLGRLPALLGLAPGSAS